MNFPSRPQNLASPKTDSGSNSPAKTPEAVGETASQVQSADRRRSELRKKWMLQDLRYIGLVFLVTRLALVLIGLVAQSVFPPDPIGKPAVLSQYPWLDMWGVWDSYWYMDIIQNGYSTVGRLPEFPAQTNLPFFPLYPLLTRLVGSVMGGNYFVAGLLISNVCLLLSCYFLYLLVRLERGRKMARRTVKYLLLFPVSFVLSGLFTEALYLCLALLCFYLARRRRWWLAGVCGAALSATRTLGVLMVLPLAFEYMRSIRFRPRAIRWNSLFVLLVPLGLVAFSVYNYQLTGDFLFFKTNQAAWDREVVNPALSLWRAIAQAGSGQSVKQLLEICFFLAALGVLMRFYRALGFSYWLFGMYSLLIPLAAGIASMPRYTVSIFPLFIGLALMTRQQWSDRAITATFCVLQAGLMMLWCTGQGLII
ncbi:MAG: hypothetical protein DCF25_12935 [Leptolyngbya foveolarum]|uniref:Uncharacterized protein n=1 Tax=Leptolyngbya foveolarum TaxID=47253 RepID=A0A2W4U4S5_9CYAN|nr:MAG: hypothetical protein DCF25_12935 [Leptolyngbya foveolarum]